MYYLQIVSLQKNHSFSYLVNPIIRLSYFSMLYIWKFSHIIMFTKRGKVSDDPASFRPISLFPFFSKICVKLILKRLFSHIIFNNVLSHLQFGFRCKHSIIHQVHRVVDAISSILKRNNTVQVFFLTYLKRVTGSGIRVYYLNPRNSFFQYFFY